MYDELYLAVGRRYRRKWWWIPSSAVGLVAGLVAWALNPGMEAALERAPLSILTFGVFFVGTLLLLMGRELVSGSEREFEHVEDAINLLRQKVPKDANLSVVEKRAQNSSQGASTQVIIPLLLLPILVSVLTATDLPFTKWIYLLLAVELLAFPLLLVLVRAQVASIMLHALAEYQSEQSDTAGLSEDSPFAENLLGQPAVPEERSLLHRKKTPNGSSSAGRTGGAEHRRRAREEDIRP
ncbi:MAG: hypothetical protein M3220_12790 [Chloroflexota bacterium]|nr:hypothetical protein [Chloroflexota bacterium]